MTVLIATDESDSSGDCGGLSNPRSISAPPLWRIGPAPQHAGRAEGPLPEPGGRADLQRFLLQIFALDILTKCTLRFS
ncbi:hypothetical protein NM680_02265 [Paracoccus sp. PS-1]|uniref:hypothetical protein n=1 Tax=unclassified Paracoccus (in: a-proteobacteria) TaxID=2688777 RepID=UPI0012EC3593|nr:MULTISPECIES: hypothetical protein [unclassified Paracoccus (in: a-proteobacteria)]MDQ7260618.1 hypothetical protein [Paracoccus sp. PS1]